MPVIRLNDAAFMDLKDISKWLETSTPSETIDLLVQEKMQNLGLERGQDIETEIIRPDVDVMEFKKAPGLAFTRVIQARVNNKDIKKGGWSGLLLGMILAIKERGYSANFLVNELHIPSKTSEYSEQGYKYDPEIGVSIQGQSAQDAWKEVNRLANKHKIPVEVKFQWRDNKKAQYPSQMGRLRSGEK